MYINSYCTYFLLQILYNLPKKKKAVQNRTALVYKRLIMFTFLKE